MDGQLIATVATDINARVLGDAEITVRYRADGGTERTVATIKALWQADKGQVEFALAGYGYGLVCADGVISGWDLIADDGCVIVAEVGLQSRVLTSAEHPRCGGDGVCVQNRFERRGPQQLLHITKFICQGCGDLFTLETDGG